MPSTWRVTREIVRDYGYGTSGLLRGMNATVIRNTLFNGVYFGSYYNMKHFFVPPEVMYSICNWLYNCVLGKQRNLRVMCVCVCVCTQCVCVYVHYFVCACECM